MSDGPYRYAKSYRGQWHVENDSGAFLWFDREEDAKETCHHMNVAWRLAHRAALEKAVKVVEAARELIAAFDAANEVKYDENKWDRLVGGGSHERMREALADYDRA